MASETRCPFPATNFIWQRIGSVGDNKIIFYLMDLVALHTDAMQVPFIIIFERK